MLDKKLIDDITALIRREVVPAIGCTEPAAVALAVAKATEMLGICPESLRLHLSANILKNAMGVGIPGTGMIGLPIAVALGATIGKSEYGLEVLRDVNPEAVENGKKFIAEDRIHIALAPDAPSKLYIDVVATAGDDTARAVISRSHTNFVRLEHNGKVERYDPNVADDADGDSNEPKLKMKLVWDYAMQTPVGELKFILEARRLNEAAAHTALNGDYGHSLGATIRRNGAKYMGDSYLDHMMAATSAACDARMGGAPIAVMSNSGSGNQGITATMPVVSFANDIQASEEQLIRALTLSHLTSIYIKQRLGRLSALCGCVVASTGASSGITYLMGGDFPQICAAIKNMVATLTGMICDGAKPSCSMKISSGVSTAMLSAILAMNGKCVTSAEGIVADDIDRTILNLTSIGREAMLETDRYVLQIMTCK